MNMVTARFARCAARAKAIGARVSQLPSGKVWCETSYGLERDFTTIEKVEAWLESAENLMGCKLTEDHRDAADACGWILFDSTRARGGPGRIYELINCHESITTASIDVIESKLAKLKAEGADLL